MKKDICIIGCKKLIVLLLGIFMPLSFVCAMGKHKMLSHSAGDGSEGLQAALPRGNSEPKASVANPRQGGVWTRKVMTTPPTAGEEFSCAQDSLRQRIRERMKERWLGKRRQETGSQETGFGLGGIDARIRLEWISRVRQEEAGFVYGPGDYGRKLQFGGRERFYEIHIPSQYNSAQGAPVVLVFHGGGGYPGAVRYESGMDEIAERESFIAAYPAGTSRSGFTDRLLLWNDGRPYKDGTYSAVDDVGFVTALLDDLATLFNVDARRVYACGFSNGAQFTYRLSKRLSWRIAAVAAVAGHRPTEDSFDPSPGRPISVMQFSGLKDTFGPYYGGSPYIPGTQSHEAELKTDLKPVKEVIQSWAIFNRCPVEPEIKRVGNALMASYGPCDDNTEVTLWTLEDGGHTWPGGKMLPSEVAAGQGYLNQDISASELMWEFFKRHPMKE